MCCFLEQETFTPQKVLVIPRNRWLRLNMTEKLFTGTLNHNQNKNKKTTTYDYELSTLASCQDLNLSPCVNISKESHNKTEYIVDTIYDRFTIAVCPLGLILNILNIIAIMHSSLKLTPHSKLFISLAVSDVCIALHTICSLLIKELRKYYDVDLCFEIVLQSLFIPGVIRHQRCR